MHLGAFMDFDAHLLQYTAPCRHQLVRMQVRVRFVMPAAGQTGPLRRFQLTDSFTVISFCSYTKLFHDVIPGFAIFHGPHVAKHKQAAASFPLTIHAFLFDQLFIQLTRRLQ